MSLIDDFVTFVQGQIEQKTGVTRDLGGDVGQRDFGPVIQFLIREGLIPADFEDRPGREQREILEGVDGHDLNRAVGEIEPMTDFTTFMSIFMDQCAGHLTGEGSGDARNRKFKQGVEIWNREKTDIQAMSPNEVRRNLECP